MLQQAQGGCVRRQHVPARHSARPSAPLCACCAARMRHGALVLEYRAGHVQQLHSGVHCLSLCLTCSVRNSLLWDLAPLAVTQMCLVCPGGSSGDTCFPAACCLEGILIRCSASACALATPLTAA
jgi:hypothetical protein